MAARGRGRGRGSFINRPLFAGSKPEDSLPPTGQPPPFYPPLKFKPVPLPTGKKISYLLNLKQEIRSAIRESGYYIPPVSTKKDIERYTDKYQQIQAADEIHWDKSLFPRELFDEPPKKKRKVKKKVAIVEKLKVLEDKEKTDEKDENEDSDEEIENEEEEFDEELEEETDYAQNYFDNGESYLDEDDDNLDEGYE